MSKSQNDLHKTATLADGSPKKAGRPPKNPPTAYADQSPSSDEQVSIMPRPSMDEKTTKNMDALSRPKRTPLHQQKRERLSGLDRPGWVRRWFNDVDNRILQAQKAGWNVCYHDHAGGIAGSEDLKNAGSTGTVVTQTCNTKGLRIVLMEIPEEFYNDDQLAKADRRKQEMKELLTPPNQLHTNVKIVNESDTR